MMYKKKPKDFNPRFDIVSCILINGNKKFLLLRRGKDSPQPMTWGVPAGKVETGENLKSAVIREVKEETGIFLHQKDVKTFRTVFVKYPDYDFVYHMFYVFVDSPKVRISKEHMAYSWVDIPTAFNKELINDLDKCMINFRKETGLL